jgi:hypothetical protein
MALNGIETKGIIIETHLHPDKKKRDATITRHQLDRLLDIICRVIVRE